MPSNNPFEPSPYHSKHRSTSENSLPPLPPPSSVKKSYSNRMPSSRDNHRDITEAVRETVTIRGSNERAKLPRSQTTITPSTQNAVKSSRPSGNRSISQDSPVEKTKSSKPRPKKGSQHADVIDRLDFTGVGPMFHHDGPFDACAPSRNKHRTKAPMNAWTPRSDGANPLDHISNDSPYPTSAAMAAHPTFSYEYEQPKKRVDAIAEAWGIHEPEPFEEFAAGGGRPGDTPKSSIYNGRTGHRSEESPRSRHNHKRSLVPPPQPIFDGEHELGSPEPIVTSPGSGPKRSKSLMHRIRKMRETPNVPVGNYSDLPPSPNSTSTDGGEGQQRRRAPRTNNIPYGNEATSPVSDRSVDGSAYVYIDKPREGKRSSADKDLPATPGSPHQASYFDDRVIASGNPTSPGLGRKTSLMKRMKGVVRGVNK